MPPVQYQSKNLNHLGLVAAMCRELKIAEYIDARITNDSDVRNVTIGQAVVADHQWPGLYRADSVPVP